MKKITVISLTFFLSSTLFFSCSLSKQEEFAKRKYYDFPRSHLKPSRFSETFKVSGIGMAPASSALQEALQTGRTEQLPVKADIQNSDDAEVHNTMQEDKQPEYSSLPYREKLPYITNRGLMRKGHPTLKEKEGQGESETMNALPLSRFHIPTYSPFLPSRSALTKHGRDLWPVKEFLMSRTLNFIIMVILGIIIPPLGVFFYDWFENRNTYFQKKLSPSFWASLILLLIAIGFIPFRTTSLINILEWVFYGASALIAELHIFDIIKI